MALALSDAPPLDLRRRRPIELNISCAVPPVFVAQLGMPRGLTMKFAMLIYNNRAELERRSDVAEHANHETYQAIVATPSTVGGVELELIALTKTVRVRDSKGDSR